MTIPDHNIDPRKNRNDVISEIKTLIQANAKLDYEANVLKEKEKNPGWPSPLADQVYHGLAGEIIETILPHTEADPAAILVQFFASFGNVIGPGPHFKVEADIHHMNIFPALVGETSKGRKGTSAGYPRMLFDHVDSDWVNNRIQTGLSSGEGLIWSVRDAIFKSEPIRDGKEITGYREVQVDSGIEDKRLLVYEPELASTLRVLGRDGNTLSACIRQAWDTGHLRTMTKNSPTKASGAHISIIGHITRDELVRYLDRTEVGNGFANRFLWVCVRRSKCLPEGGNIQDVNLNPLIQRLDKAIRYARTVGEMRRDDQARQIWWEVYPELSEGHPGLFGAVTSRAEAQVLRLSCIYALLDCSAVVRKEHLLAALGLWEYCEASCSRE